MSLKITHVVRQYHPSVGGMEEVVHNIARQQRERYGHIPRIVTLDRLFRNTHMRLAAQDEWHGIAITRLPYYGSSRYPLCPAVLQHVRDADLIHVHGVDFFFDYLAAIRPFHRRPMVASTHGGFFHTAFASRLKKAYFGSITRASARAYDKVIATSENDGAMFRSIVPASKMAVIENGVNIEKYRDQAAPQATPTLIYFGRWSENKGLLETLAWFQALLAQQVGWKLIIAGREYDLGASTLYAAIRQRGLASHVSLVPNPSDATLAQLISQASYFICQSRHEGFGIAPIEAMSAGLIPVLSDIPPFRNLITQSRLGLLLAAGEGITQVTQLLEMHAQPSAVHGARRAAAMAFAERYDWKYVADKYVSLYHELCGVDERSAA